MNCSPSRAYSSDASPLASAARPSRRSSAASQSPVTGRSNSRLGAWRSLAKRIGSLVRRLPSAAVTWRRTGSLTPGSPASTRNSAPSALTRTLLEGGSTSTDWISPSGQVAQERLLRREAYGRVPAEARVDQQQAGPGLVVAEQERAVLVRASVAVGGPHDQVHPAGRQGLGQNDVEAQLAPGGSLLQGQRFWRSCGQAVLGLQAGAGVANRGAQAPVLLPGEDGAGAEWGAGGGRQHGRLHLWGRAHQGKGNRHRHSRRQASVHRSHGQLVLPRDQPLQRETES